MKTKITKLFTSIIIILIMYIPNTEAMAKKSNSTGAGNPSGNINETWPLAFNEFANSNWFDSFELRLKNHFPPIDLQEMDELYKIEVDLPGVKKDNIKLEVNNDVLVISGENVSSKEDVKKQFHRIERRSGTFYRSITLPRDIDKTKMKARLENGLLVIEIGRTKNKLPENTTSIKIE